MTSSLSAVPAARRRRAAATLGLFAMLFVAVGAVALTGAPDATVRVFAVIAFVTAGLLVLIAWGMLHSIRLDAGGSAEASLDAAIEQALADGGGMSCGCGHDHDPSEMHVQGSAAPACAHDGAGEDCEHDCKTCALAALRPSPTTPRAQRSFR